MKTYINSCEIPNNATLDEVVKQFNSVLTHHSPCQRFAPVQTDRNDIKKFRLITQWTDDWGMYEVYGYVVDRPLTQQEKFNIRD